MTLRSTIAALLIASPAAAQSCPTGLTPVVDTISAPAGPTGVNRRFVGTVTLSLSTPFDVGGVTYGRVPFVVTVTGSGVFAACLAPNAGANVAGTSYAVRFQHHDAQGSAIWSETWSVPSSSSPVTIPGLRVALIPTPNVLVQWSQLPVPPPSGTYSVVSNNGAVTWSAGTSPVSSVFGRTGAIVAVSGDYTAAQITNAVDSTGSYANPAWITSLAWSKLTGLPSLVNSFNGRAGAVVPVSGDYTAAQVTNAVDSTGSYANPAWITSLAWSKLTGLPSLVNTFNGRAGTVVPASNDYSFSQLSGSVAASQLPTNNRVGGFLTMFRGTDASTAGTVLYVTVPYACTITDWVITADSTATIKLWRVADGGTALPTSGNSLSTSGFAISSGTRLHSTTLSDLSSTAIAAYDTLGVDLFATASTHVEFALGCSR